jgi:hypothetical protein
MYNSYWAHASLKLKFSHPIMTPLLSILMMQAYFVVQVRSVSLDIMREPLASRQATAGMFAASHRITPAIPSSHFSTAFPTMATGQQEESVHKNTLSLPKHASTNSSTENVELSCLAKPIINHHQRVGAMDNHDALVGDAVPQTGCP